MHTTEEKVVTDEQDKEESGEESGRYDVYTITLRARKIHKGIDVTLEEMGDELEVALNDIVKRGGKLQFMHYAENRGLVVVGDMMPPHNPFEMMSGPVPVRVARGTASAEEEDDGEDTPTLHPSLQRVLPGWFNYMDRSNITRGSTTETKELRDFFSRAFADEGGEELRKMIDSIKAVTVEHVKNCDGVECDTERFFKLATLELEGILKERLQ